MTGAPRFGVAIVASEPPEDFIQSVKLAERLGFDSIWVPDYRLYHDVYVSLALVALNTSRVRLGCAVTNPYTRHPALSAVGITTVDTISGGRAVLGLGAGGMVLSLLQVEQHLPVQTCRKAVEDIRGYLSDNSVPGRGHELGGAGAGVPLDIPTRADLPIFIAATGRNMLALAGEVADGVIVNVGAQEDCIDAALTAVEEGMARAGRSPESLERICWLQGTAVDSDFKTALNRTKATAALVLGNAPKWMLEAMELDVDEVEAVRKVYYAEGAQSAAKLLTDEMAEKFTIAGTPQHAIRKLKRLIEQGFGEFIFVIEESGGNQRTSMRALGEQVVAELR